MDSTLKIWAVIVLVGVLNYASRLSFIAFFARRAMPPLLARALRYVPAAMLTALIVPMVVEPAGLATDFATPRVAAAIATGVTAWFTRSTLVTLGVGMGTLWLLAWAAH
jgi:branched-subunit amino acid transport protein